MWTDNSLKILMVVVNVVLLRTPVSCLCHSVEDIEMILYLIGTFLDHIWGVSPLCTENWSIKSPDESGEASL